jgi:uncharacterized protein (TIGR04255 family)
MREDSRPSGGPALTDEHPTYPNPVIVQVTCEIAFTSDSEARLSAAGLYPLFFQEFPELQAAPTVVLAQGGPFPNQEFAQSPNAGAFRFATEDGKRFVQMSKLNFVYQSNERYPGWATFRAKLIEQWETASTQAKPASIVKVGLRYINRMARTEAHPYLSDWLQPTSDLPESLIASKEHFMGRIESSPEPSHLRLVTIAAEAPGPDWPHGTIIMDVDRISVEGFEPDTPKVVEKLDFLHEDIWRSFSSATTSRLKEHMAKAPK